MGSVVTVTGFVSRISLFLVFKTKEKYYPNITFFIRETHLNVPLYAAATKMPDKPGKSLNIRVDKYGASWSGFVTVLVKIGSHPRKYAYITNPFDKPKSMRTLYRIRPKMVAL